MLDNAIILTLIVLSFVAGLKLSDHYHAMSGKAVDKALSGQPLRKLRNTGDFDGDHVVA